MEIITKFITEKIHSNHLFISHTYLALTLVQFVHLLLPFLNLILRYFYITIYFSLYIS